MKRLFLLRHAKSSWDDPARADFDRPLAPRGERDAPRIGQRLRARLDAPAVIVTSPAARALATAELVARELGLPREALRTEPELYLASPAAILTVAARQDNDLASLLLVGHNPGITELVNRLLPAMALDNLATAGVVVIDADTVHWRAVVRARCTLAHYDYPKNRGEPLSR